MSDRAKETVRKLLAVANDSAASEAEIENAMKHAARLIDQHQIDRAELEAKTDGTAQAEQPMGRHAAQTTATNFSTWEKTLAQAVAKIFGNVACYSDNAKPVQRMPNGIAATDRNGTAKRVSQFQYYGPTEDAQEAAALFQEWSIAIATMAVRRWGGAYRGDGAAYAEGFTSALYRKAKELDDARRQITVAAKAVPAAIGGTVAPVYGALAVAGSTSLAARNEKTRTDARQWLKTSLGINLGTSYGSGGSRSGSSEARAEGRAHGQAASFGRRSAGRLALPGR